MGVFNIETQMFLLNGVNVVAGFAVNWLLQSTLLISIGLIVGAILRSRGSAVQSLVYRTTLIAVLVCPLATVALGAAGFSGWSLTMPEAWVLETRDRSPAADLNAEIAPAFAHKEPVRELPIQLESSVPEIAELQIPFAAAESPQISGADESPIEVLEASTETTDVSKVEAVLPAINSVFRIRTFGLLASLSALIWCLVTLVLVFRLASAWWKLWLLKSRATKVEPELHLACEQLAIRMKVAAPEVYRSPFLPSPCLAGFRNPSILLPESDCGLSMQDVLIHELAHLRRHDCHWNLLRQVATSVFFFQPLLWILSRKLEITAEEVCDDFVVQFGGDRVDYANRLVDLAELSSAPIAAAGVGVVSFRSMLTQRVTRILDTSRTLSTRVGNLILAIVLAGGLLGTCMTGMLGLNPAGVSEPTAVADNSDADDEAKSSLSSNSDIKFRGIVTDENDRPVANATVEMQRRQMSMRLRNLPPIASTTSSVNGEFELSIDMSKFPNKDSRFWKQTLVFARADGLGVAWLDGEKVKPEKSLKLRLVADDVPIKGQVVSLEGKPLAGVSVRVGLLLAAEQQSLDPVLEAWNRGQVVWQATGEHVPNLIRQFPTGFQQNTKTDAEGFFTIRGLGKERVINAVFEGPTIAFTRAKIVTRNMDRVFVNDGMPSPESSRKGAVYGAQCVIAVPPSQPVTGIVKDSKTGEPMSGVAIESYKLAGGQMVAQREIRVETDENGRYTLTGLPKGLGNKIIAVPNDDQPYLMRVFDVPNPTGMKPIDLDLELSKGVWITGSLKDKSTGKNIQIQDEAYVYYFPYLANPFAQETPEYSRQNFFGYQQRYKIAADGSYRLVGLPGKAIVGAKVARESYPQGQGSDKISGADDRGRFPTFRLGVAPSGKWPTIMREVDIAEAESAVEVDLQLDRGKKIAIEMTDPEGKSLAGVAVLGRGPDEWWPTIPTSRFEAVAFAPGEKRTMLFHHPGRKLGLVKRVSAGDQADQKVSVQLEPCVTIRGRLVDEDNSPVTGARIRIEVSPSEDFSPELKKQISTDADGRFVHTEVLPGSDYAVMAESASIPFTVVAKNLKVAPGETIDLGTVDVSQKERPKPVRTIAKSRNLGDVKLLSKKSTKEFTKGAGKANSDKNKIGSYSGFVKSPEGEPIIGAKIWLAVTSYEYNSEKNKENREGLLRELATADEQGRFEVQLDAATVQEIRKRRHFARPQLVAMAQGRGLDWLPLEVFQDDPARSASRDLLHTRIDKALGEGRFNSRTLKLRPELQPVRGRLVDLEGAPLPKVTVAIDSLRQPDVARLINGFERSWKQEINEAFAATLLGIGGLARSELQRLIPPVKTNENGEFELSGIGDDQLATLIFNGDRIEARPIFVFGREMKTVNLPHDDAFPKGTKDIFVGRKFTYAAGPSIPVEGIVADFDTGAPVANVLVYVERLFQNGNGQLRLDSCHMRAVTDGQGRFRITGMPPGEGHVIEVVPPKSEPYLMTTKAVSPDLQEGEVNHVEIQLKRGLWIEGRITDKQTGAPLSARVDYMVLKRNPLAGDKLVRDSPWLHHRYHTDSDGRYRMPGLPGPGVLLVKSQVSNYPLAAGAEKIDGYSASSGKVPTVPFALQGPQLSQWHLLSQIDPAVGAVSVRRDLMLDSSRSIRGRVIGPDNKPISDLFVLGQTEKDKYFRPKPADNVPTTDWFTVNGYDGNGPRHLFFKNKAETLVGKYRLEGDAPEEIVVTAQRSVRVTGRLNKQKDDLPAAHYFVACEKCLLPGDKVSSVDFGIHWCHTDDDGRFDIKGLMAGNLYKMVAFDRSIAKDIHFTIDLTDAKPGDVTQIGNVLDVDGKSSVDVLGQRPETIEPNTSKLVRTVASPQKTTQGKSESATSDATATEKSAAGTTSLQVAIALPDGSAAEEAHVALIGVSRDYSKSLLLGNAITGKDGTCTLTYKGLSETAEEWLQLIARKDGAAIGWMKLNQSDLESDDPFEFSLNEQGIVNGRLVDIDGQPAPGETLQVQMVMNPKAERVRVARAAGNGIAGTEFQAWIQPVSTDSDGRFQLTGIPKSFAVSLKLIDSKKFAPQRISLNTGMSEQRGPRDGTYRPLVKNFEPGEEVVLTLSPAKIITGRITYEDTNEPVANAKVSIWSSQQQYGSMFSVHGRTDEEGKYRILPNPGIRFGVSAYPPQGVAYMGREAEELKWENSDTNRNVDIQLPRVTLVKGLVIEKGTGLPVSDATITFESSGKDAPKNAIIGWEAQQKTDNDGKFTYAVPLGRGTLVVRKKDSNYVLQTMESRMMTKGKPGGARFYANAFHSMTVEKGTDSIDAEIEVVPGKTVRGVMVDGEGKLIEEAIILTRLKSWDLAGRWRADNRPTLGGKFELTGLEPGESYKVHFLDAKRKLGATIDLKATDEEVKVVLQPCGSATAKFIVEDEDDREKMTTMQSPALYFRLRPGVTKFDFNAMRLGKLAADEEFNVNIDQVNYGGAIGDFGPKLDDELRVTYPALIPGATYRLQTSFARGVLDYIGYKEFTVEPGQLLDLGEFTPKF